MKRLKRLAALFMAVAMLMTSAATTAVAAGEVYYNEIDLRGDIQGESIEETFSINHDSPAVGFSFFFISDSKITSTKFKTYNVDPDAPENTHGLSAQMDDVEQDGSTFRTMVWLRHHTNYSALTANNVGKGLKDTLLITLANGKKFEIPYSFTYTNEPFMMLTRESAQLAYAGIAVGESITLEGRVIDKANVTGARPIVWSWSITSGNAFGKVVGNGSTAVVTGLAAGSFRLLISVSGPLSLSYGYTLDVTGELAPGVELGDAKEELAGGTNASVNVAPNQGLSSSDLLDLKAAAGGAGAKVELSFNNDSDLTLSFDPAAIPDNWSGKPFTPAFTPAMPDAAKKEGFSKEGGKWLDFAYSGALPAPMTVTMKVAPNTYPEGTTALKVWYFDPASKKLVEQPLAVEYDAATGKITFTLDHFSAYLICADGVDPNADKKPPVVDSGDRDSGRPSSEDDSNSVESLRLVAEQTLWNKTASQLSTAEGIASLPTGSAVVNGKTISAPMLTLNADEVKQLPSRVVDQIAGRDILLRLTAKGQSDAIIHGLSVKPCEPNRIFYRIEDFRALYAPEA